MWLCDMWTHLASARLLDFGIFLHIRSENLHHTIFSGKADKRYPKQIHVEESWGVKRGKYAFALASSSPPWLLAVLVVCLRPPPTCWASSRVVGVAAAAAWRAWPWAAIGVRSAAGGYPPRRARSKSAMASSLYMP